MKKRLLLLLILTALLFPINKAFALDIEYVPEAFTITKYSVEINVLDNNVLEVTENIDVNFNDYRHGIFRKIPIKNHIIRNDGTTETNRALISNINVSENYKVSVEGDNKVIKIGDADTEIFGPHHYTISYKYDLGKDRNKDYGELYFNIIGTEWDTTIENVFFTIHMPKEFDSSKLGFSVGSLGDSGYDENKLTYKVDGTTITGYYADKLNMYEGINVRLELPNGYFVVKDRLNILTKLLFIVPLIGIIISVLLWIKYGKDEQVVETVEFYPPDNLNSLELAQVYKGKADSKDVISLLIYLANKGYIKIEEEKDGHLFKKTSFRIIKLKEYDGNNYCERSFFNRLFFWGHTEAEEVVVDKDELKDNFYVEIDSLLDFINHKSRVDDVVVGNGFKIFGIIILMILTIIIMFLSPLYEYFGFLNLHINYIFDALKYNRYCFIGFWLSVFSVLFMIFIVTKMDKKTTYGTLMNGRIKGFKKFLQTAEKDRLEALVQKNPSYFYDILPYAYVLGVSDNWMKKFEVIAIEPPNWYDFLDDFDLIHFNMFMDETLFTAQKVMTSRPIETGSSDWGSGSSSDGGFSGGGSSGGGFSGGGSGGGGGGSW